MTEHDDDRRTFLKQGLGAGALAIGAGAFPWSALAQDGGERVPFLDVPDSFNPGPRQPGATHFIDTRDITNFHTDDFYVVQHYGQPDLDPAQYQLKVTGLVDQPATYTLADLMDMASLEQDIGFECGGNGGRMFHGLVGNARWRGVSLRRILEQAGIQEQGREVVFFGADTEMEEIRGEEVEKAFARSLSVEDAMRQPNMLAYEMNGEPLPLHHGKPLRLIVPGFYGVANVKWLTQIHVQDTRYMGRFMGRDYVTLKREMVGDEERWVENSVARMNLKSVIARVTRQGGRHRITGFALNDGTPLRSVEVKVDDGPWREARIDPRSSTWSWKLFHFDWEDATPGEHTIVSRVTDVNGNVQLPADELPERVSYWEEYGRFPRRVRIG